MFLLFERTPSTNKCTLNNFRVHLVLLVFISLSILSNSCSSDCTSIHLVSSVSNYKNAALITLHSKERTVSDSLLFFQGNRFEFKRSELKTDFRRIIVFPSHSKPTSSDKCRFDVGQKNRIPVVVYYDTSYHESIMTGQLEKLFYSINKILEGFQNGHSFVLKDHLPIDYKLTSRIGDKIYKDLKEQNIINDNNKWHLILLSSYFSGSAAFHAKSFDNHFVISDDFLLNNPIAILHELLHGFPGHVDLESDDSWYNDSSAVVQNIMYNYDIPRIPKYSFYQNMFANEITGSSYLGINGFPLNQNFEDIGINNYNLPPKKQKVLISDANLGNESIAYFLKLLENPFENYLLSYESTISDFPEIVPCRDELEAYLFEPHSEVYLDHYKSLLEKEAKYLSILGLYSEKKYIQNRMLKHREMRERKIVHWLLSYEQSIGTHYLNLSSLLSTSQLEYYQRVTDHHPNMKSIKN